MKNYFISKLAPFLLVYIFVVQTAQAADIRAASGKPYLTFDGTTATCTAICQGNSATDQIDATLTLYYGSSQLKSWHSSGIGQISLSGECTVKRGKTYSLELIYAVNGVEKAAITTTNTCT